MSTPEEIFIENANHNSDEPVQTMLQDHAGV